MAKEPEPKSTGEGQNTVGSLSDYVSGRLNDIAAQKANAEAQARTTKDKEMELFLQRTALLRAYLLELAAPMDELLSHFRVRELLEEVRSNHSRNGTIKTVVPYVYEEIVTQPDPSLNFFYDIYNATNSQPLTLNDLLSSGDFRSIVPSLIGYADYRTKTQPRHAFGSYGLVLEREVQMRREITRSVPGSAGEYRWLGPGAGDVFFGRDGMGPGMYVGMVAKGTGKWENFTGIESMFVEVVKTDESKLTYALEYSRRRSGDLVASPRRVHADQPPEILKQLIGDVIVKEVGRNI